jgi:hypothetical protein
MKRTLIVLSAIGISLLFSQSTFSQAPSREDIKNQIERKRAELVKLEEQFLAPTEADRTAYAELLAQPNTGLIRLLPREKYDSDGNNKIPKTLTMRGGGAYYSFSRLTHEYGYGSDIELQRGELTVGFAGADYGMMLKLGSVPLEEVSLEHGGVKALANYVTVTSEPDARAEYRRFGQGAEIDGTVFKSRLPLEVEATYVLRSIDFSASDTLVAFHVVRKDDDGSAILAWRLLKKYATPNLARISQAETQIR